MARRRIACDPARRVRYRPSPDTASRRDITDRIARRRIACGTVRRRIASRCVPARVGDQDVPAVSTVGRAERPSSAMPRPNSACNRRRQPRLTNMYSFVVPWRSIVAQSAARLRRTVGPLSTPKAVAGRTGSSNITGNNRPSSGHFRTFPDISGHFRASSGHRRTRKDHRVPYRPSPVTPSRMARRGRKEPVPDRVR